MKVWKAELILFLNDRDEYETKFLFELSDKDYKINEERKEYLYFKDWVGERIPMNMSIDRTYCGDLKAIQGFDRELSEIELKDLEIAMKKLLKKQLDFEKEKYLKEYNKKINIL